MRRALALALVAVGGVAAALALAGAGSGSPGGFTATASSVARFGSCSQLSVASQGTLNGAAFRSAINVSFNADGTPQSATDDLSGAVSAHSVGVNVTGTCTDTGFSVSGTFTTHVSAPDAGDGISTIQVSDQGYSHSYKPDDQPPPGTTVSQVTTTVMVSTTTAVTSTMYTTTSTAPPPHLSLKVASRFAVGKTFTTVKRLSVSGLSRTVSVDLACIAKQGCPFRQALAKGNVDFTAKLRTARLRPGARLELTAVSPGMVGTFVRYTMRAHAQPFTTRLCLEPRATRPRACS